MRVVRRGVLLDNHTMKKEVWKGDVELLSGEGRKGEMGGWALDNQRIWGRMKIGSTIADQGEECEGKWGVGLSL